MRVSTAASLLTTTTLAAAQCSSQCKPFTLDLTWGPTDSSNTLSRNAILSNGSFPGPPLRLNVGDCVDFTINNNLPNATGVHFHGIRQLGTPWADGTPGISQTAVQPGSSYNYQWTADESGVYFYHSHYKGQIMDGLYGAIIISGGANETKPFSSISGSSSDVAQMIAAEASVETVLTSDWNQLTFNELFQAEMNANIDASCVDQFVLNGMGSSYCLSATDLAANEAIQTPQILNGTSLTAKGCIPPSNIAVQGPYQRNLAALPAGVYDVCTPTTGKNYTYSVDAADGWAAMAFISPAGSALFRITIDSHKMYVYEVNGAYITPQPVDQIEVDNGDRISVMIKLDAPAADYAIRVANSGINQIISGFGTLSYKGSSGAPSSAVALMNYGGQNTSAITAINRAAAAPLSAPAMSQTADVSFVLDIMKTPNDTESWSWVLNGAQPFNQSVADDQAPLLAQGPSVVPQSDLILRTNYNQWVDLIIKIAGPLAEPHPIHKHANKFYVIGAGLGDFNYTNVADAQAGGLEFNMVNPPYVDGYTSIPAEGEGAWMVFRYQANTPGAWLLHCHVQTHFSGGMAVAILDAVDQFPTVPSNVGQTCAANGHGKGNGSATSTATSSASASGSAGWNSWAWGDASSTSTAAIATSTNAAAATATSAYSAAWAAVSSTGSAAWGAGSAAAGTSTGAAAVATSTGSAAWAAASGSASDVASWGAATSTAGAAVATFTGAASSFKATEMSVLAVVLGAFGLFL